MLENDGLDQVVNRLAALAGDLSKSKTERAKSYLVASNLHWRHGDREAALNAVEQALRVEVNGDVLLQKARLVDGAGEDARDLYEKALSLMSGRPEEESIRLRLTFMEVNESTTSALLGLAEDKDQAFQNRIAVALALLGYYKQAIDLFDVTGETSAELERNQMRLVEWSIRAKDAPLARESALELLSMLDQRADRLYALSLLVEAHRLDDSLDSLIDYFAGEEGPIPEARPIWIELLRERGRFSEALALFKSPGIETFDATQRRQLISMYREADREQGMVDEYRALIRTQADDVGAYAGLSEYYVVVGDPEEAETVWRTFIRNNAPDEVALLSGVKVMAKMGFNELGIEALNSYMTSHQETASMLFFMHELYKKMGQFENAEQVLERQDATLSPSDPARSDLARAYEKLDRPEKALFVMEQLGKDSAGLTYNEKMGLARLYDRLGRPEKSLALWQELWSKITTPARRSFVEDRMMAYATGLGRLDAIAVDLEQRLRSGIAGKHDKRLLLRVYIRALDKVSAVEVIDEYYSEEETVESLKELATVYRLLEDGDGYEQTSWDLINEDPENKSRYLQNIILRRIERADVDRPEEQKIAEIRTLLDRLRDTDPDAASGGFEAGVMVLSGLEDEGVAAYHRALALDPGLGDNYLLLANVLKQRRQWREAVTLLQYLAETTDDDGLFVIAIDGILNTLSVAWGWEVPAAGRGKVLQWVQRIVLERLTADVDDIQLYDILADVSDELSDGDMRLTATEGKLVLSRNIRGSVLRWLVALTAPWEPSLHGRASSTADPERRLAYGRRIVALEEAMPPVVYIDLGESFLEKRDPLGATRALSLAYDMIGRTEIITQSARVLDAAGYDDLAIGNYNRSIVRDKNNVAIMTSLAKVHERGGNRSLANGIYLDALNIDLSGRPVTTSNMNYSDRLRPTLVERALATWPVDSTLSRERLLVVENMLATELDAVVATGKPPVALKAFPRLYISARLARRLALATGHYDIADKWDSRLLQYFGHDAGFVASLVAERMRWGLYSSARLLADKADWLPGEAARVIEDLHSPDQKEDFLSFRAALEEAGASGDYDRALSIALLSRDQDKILSGTRAWAESGSYMEAIRWAEGRLQQKYYVNLVRYAVELVRQDSGFLHRGFSGVNQSREFSFLVKIEQITGEPVFTEAQFMQVLRTTADMTGSASVRVAPYAVNRLSTANLREFVAAYTNPDKGGFGAQTLLNIWKILLKRKDNFAYVSELTDRAITLLSNPDDRINRTRLGADIVSTSAFLAVREFDEVHIPSIRKVADFWRVKNNIPFDLNDPGFLLKLGDTDKAIDAFIEASIEIEKFIASTSPAAVKEILKVNAESFLPRFADAIKERMAEIEAEKGVMSEFVTLRERFFFQESMASPAEITRFWEDTNSQFPDNEAYLVRLHNSYLAEGRITSALKAARQLLQLDPDSLSYRLSIFTLLVIADNPLRARALNVKSPQDMLDPQFEDILRFANYREGNNNALQLRVFGVMKSLKRSVMEHHQTAIDIIRAEASGENVRSLFRGLWQMEDTVRRHHVESMKPSDWAPGRVLGTEGYAAGHMEFSFLRGGLKPVETDERFFPALAEYEFGVAELEDYLRTMPDDARHLSYTVFEDLVRAYQKQGRAQQKRKALATFGIPDGTEFTLWLALTAAEDGSLSAETLDAITLRLGFHKHLSDYQLKLIARIYARNENMREAAEVYYLLALRTLAIRAPLPPYTVNEKFDHVLSATAFVDEVNNYLKGQDRLQFIDSIITLVRPGGEVDEFMQASYREFVITSLAKSLSPENALERIIAMFGEPERGWRKISLIELMELQVRAGQPEQALGVLRQLINQSDGLVQNVDDVAGPETRLSRDVYSGMLGVSVHLRSGLEIYWKDALFKDKLFFASEYLFPAGKDGQDWLQLMHEALNDWIYDGSVEVNEALRVMAASAYAFHRSGNVEKAKAVMADISRHLRSRQQRPAGHSVSFVVAAGNEVGHKIDLDFLQGLSEAGELELSLMTDVVRRTAAEQSPAKALMLAERLTEHTRADSLLAVITSLSEQSGKNAEQWSALRRQAAEARNTYRAYKVGHRILAED